MSEDKNRNLAKLHTDYVLQHEESQISATRRKKYLYRRLAVFSILVIIISTLMVSTLISQNSELSDKRLEKEKVEKQLAALKQEETLLKEEIHKLNDDDYIAKLARREYFLSEDNETIFTLPEKKKEKEEKVAN